jgi:transketolase
MSNQPPRTRARPHALPSYVPGTMTATRTAFGDTLAALGGLRPDLVVLDGQVSDTEAFADFIRAAMASRAGIGLVGTRAGVATGQDGSSRLALEDLAALRAVRTSTVLYPCDANQAVRLTAALADVSGVSYLRASRGDTPVIYGPGEEFPIGGSRLIRRAPDDQVTLVAAGVTVHEALAAADLLADDGISARVIDAYSIKPIDAATLHEAAADTGRIITVEDHSPEGGLGDAVLDALADKPALVRKLAIREMPASASPAERLQLAGIDMVSIADAGVDLVNGDNSRHL